MAPFNSQLLSARFIVISANKQNTYGTELGDAALTHGVRFDGSAFADFPRQQFWSDAGLAKGFPWATTRVETQRDSGISLSGLPGYDFLAGWALAFCLGKDTISGTGPYTHLFTSDLTTLFPPVTTLFMQDTADIKRKLQDMAVTKLTFSGGKGGILTMDMELVGSGRFADAPAFTPPALVAPAIMLNRDCDTLLGPPGAPVSIKERIATWQVSIDTQMEAVHHPGSGLFAGFHRRGDPKFSCSLTVEAKDVDDIDTLLINGTLQELKFSLNSGAANQLILRFPNVRLKGGRSAESRFVAYNLTIDDDGLFKIGAAEPFEATVINSQATYLVGA